MRKFGLLLATLVLPAAAQAQQGMTVSADFGLAFGYRPEWIGSEDFKATPRVILRNFELSAAGESPTAPRQGFSLSPSFDWRGGRDASDSDSLTGMDDIDGTLEAGLRLNYVRGPLEAQVSARKGIGGHDGIVGSVGAKYRIPASERLTLWPAIEARFGDNHFADEFFGVSGGEAIRSGYVETDPDGGFYEAAIGIEARYALTPTLSLVGEAEYARLVGDAADAPFIEDKAQPSLRIGVVNRFSFRF